MAEDNKSLPASTRKRLKLREQGTVVRSHDMVTTVTIGSSLFGLMYFGSRLASQMADVMEQCFTELGKPAGRMSVTDGVMPLLGGPVFISLFIFLGIICLAVILTNLVQTGPMLVTDQLFNGARRMNPIAGIKNIFSMRKLVALVQALVKLTIIVCFAYAAVKELWQSPVFSRPVNVQELGVFFQEAAWGVGWRVLLALMLISATDYLYQKIQYEKDNRMSLFDVKDELKQSEGSAEVKNRQRGLMRRRRSMRRMLEDMSSATVVITNPTHFAVALRYERSITPTPVIVAKGTRRNAVTLKARAAELGVPMLENVPLAQGLYKHGEVGEPIPSLYYHAVAEVLALLFRRGYRPTR